MLIHSVTLASVLDGIKCLEALHVLFVHETHAPIFSQPEKPNNLIILQPRKQNRSGVIINKSSSATC